VRKLATTALVCLALAAGCSHQQLERTGDKMIRVERGTEGLVAEVVKFKDDKIAECREQSLPSEAERAACVEPATKLVEGTEPAVQALRAALITFWELYPVLEARLEGGERITPEEIAELSERAGRVLAEYATLVQMIREAKSKE